MEVKLSELQVEDGPPRCFHCDAKLPPETVMTVNRKMNAVTAHCPFCGCLTPFQVTEWEKD